MIDEVRISAKARSADWIAAQYKSMMDTFATYGGEQSYSTTEQWGENSNCDYTGVTEDTYLDQGNSGTYNMGTTTLIRVGDNDGHRPVRIMIQFDFSNVAISDSNQITSAKLYLRNNDFEASGDHVDVFRVKKQWNGGNTDYAVPPEGDDAVTWTYQYSTQTSWTGAGCDNSADRETTAEDTQTISNQGVWYSWDVTDSAKYMFDNSQYYGWILISQEEDDGTQNKIRFDSSERTTTSERPYLEITYSPPLVAPADLQQIHYRWRNDDGGESGSETVTVVDASSGYTDNSDTITIQHTVSGSNRLMLVGVSVNNDNSETV
jgi:hypothetical protein